MKEYVGIIWIGDEPGKRFRILAESGEEAENKLNEMFGEGHIFTLYNEEEANRPR